MNISLAGVHLIASFEGFVPTPYNDAADNATIGYGHELHAGPVTAADREHWGSLTPGAGLVLLDKDVAVYSSAVAHHVNVSLGIIPARAQARFDALCSLCFNIGVGAFAGSTVLRLVNEKGAPRDWHPVATAMLAWDHAGGDVVPGLLARRQKEAALVISGKYPLTR